MSQQMSRLLRTYPRKRMVRVTEEQLVEHGIPGGAVKGFDYDYRFVWIDKRRWRRHARVRRVAQ